MWKTPSRRKGKTTGISQQILHYFEEFIEHTRLTIYSTSHVAYKVYLSGRKPRNRLGYSLAQASSDGHPLHGETFPFS
jgi:hypothetical protein